MVEKEFDGFDGNGKSKALAESDLHVSDADDLAAHIEERAAAVAGIDLGRGLKIKLATQLPGLGAEYAFGNGAFQAERAADRKNTLTHRHGIGPAHHGILEFRRVALHKFADLALLKIQDPDAPRFKALPLGSSDALAVGQHVFAIGSPLGLERTVTEGILSTKTRPMQGELYLQTTAQINPGNSGGPLFNLRGEVVGVTNMKIIFGEGLGFAIPIEAVKNFLSHRDAYAYDNDNPSNPYRYLEPPSRARKQTDAR